MTWVKKKLYSLLVKVLQTQPDTSHGEKEQGPVTHTLEVLESGAPWE